MSALVSIIVSKIGAFDKVDTQKVTQWFYTIRACWLIPISYICWYWEFYLKMLRFLKDMLWTIWVHSI